MNVHTCVFRQGPYVKILAVVSNWAVFILRLHKMGHICCRLLIEAIHKLKVCAPTMCQTFFQIVRILYRTMPPVKKWQSFGTRQSGPCRGGDAEFQESGRRGNRQCFSLKEGHPGLKVARQGTWTEGLPDLAKSFRNAVSSRTGGGESSGHKGHYGRLLWGLVFSVGQKMVGGT